MPVCVCVRGRVICSGVSYQVHTMYELTRGERWGEPLIISTYINKPDMELCSTTATCLLCFHKHHRPYAHVNSCAVKCSIDRRIQMDR